MFFEGVLDAIDGGVHDINNIGRRVILPRSFDGSPRDMAGKYQDAMAICKEYGKPTFFITFTANPNWKEVRDSLLPGQCPSDRPDLVARVFHLKLKMLMNLLKNGLLGESVAFAAQLSSKNVDCHTFIFFI